MDVNDSTPPLFGSPERAEKHWVATAKNHFGFWDYDDILHQFTRLFIYVCRICLYISHTNIQMSEILCHIIRFYSCLLFEFKWDAMNFSLVTLTALWWRTQPPTIAHQLVIAIFDHTMPFRRKWTRSTRPKSWFLLLDRTGHGGPWSAMALVYPLMNSIGLVCLMCSFLIYHFCI